MPILFNPKHEKFAQLLAQGKSANESYVLAGYKQNDGNCITLKAHPKVAQRVAELQAIASNALVKHVEKHAIAQRKADEMTLDVLIGMLIEDRDFARALDNPSAANSATMGIAKLTGHVIDRQERGKPGDFDDRTPEQMRADLVEKLQRMLGENADKRLN